MSSGILPGSRHVTEHRLNLAVSASIPTGNLWLFVAFRGSSQGIHRPSAVNMKRTAVRSTSVLSVGYDPVTSELEIEFRNGRVYRYVRVPRAAHRLLMQAPSIGEFVNVQIKPRFTAVEVSES
jgi:KTSC domain